YGSPSRRPETRARLARWVRPQLDAAEAASDRQLIWARAWLGVIDAPDDLAFARALLDGAETVEGLKVDTDFRWEIVGVLATHAADDDGALIDAELQRDPTDIGQRRSALWRGARPAAEAKAEAWRRLNDERPPLATMRAICGGFWQWDQEDILRPYVDRYFSSIKGWWADRHREEALTLVGGLYPGRLI